MSNQSSEPYTDSFILDCNRNNSVEADAGNNSQPAQFTNKQGKGLKLERGDKVQVHSAFINQIGNTDGTIELKGDSLKNSQGEVITYTLQESTNTLTQPMPLDDVYSQNTNYPWTPAGTPADGRTQHLWGTTCGQNKKQILQPYGQHQSDCGLEDKTYEMKDNEMNVQCAYYKNTNGENYMHLPRRFDVGNSTSFGNGLKDTASKRLSNAFSVGFGNGLDTLPWAYQGLQWSQAPADSETQFHSIGFHDTAYNGLPLSDVRVQSQVPEDWFFQDKSKNCKSENMASGTDGQTPAVGMNIRTLNTLGTTQRFRYKNDNSRFMIFKKERTYFTSAPTHYQFLSDAQLADCVNPTNLAGSSTNDFLSYVDTDRDDGHDVRPVPADLTIRYYNVRDPACTSDWNPYYEIKNIKVESGFKAPEDIAEEVSRNLNKTSEITEVFARVGARSVKEPVFENFVDGAGTEVPSRVKLLGDGVTIADPTRGAIHQCVGLKKDGELFKSFYSTNHAHFGALQAQEYFVKTQDGTQANYPEKIPDAVRYMSSYHYIGVKRPNLWITGRKFCRDALLVGTAPGETWGEVPEKSLHPDAPAISTTGNAHHTADIITTIPWTRRHLLNDFIKSQGEYPELFDYPYSAIKLRGNYREGTLAGADVSDRKFQMGNSKFGYTLARFLHIDIAKKTSNHWKDSNNKIRHDSRRLGCDNYFNAGWTDYDIAGTETPSGYSTKTASKPPEYKYPQDRNNLVGNLPYYDLSSSPLWFWHDIDRQDIDGGGDDMSCDDFNLCFGCMKKYNPAKEGVANPTLSGEFIAFTTKRIGGIPDYIFRGCNQQNTLLNQTLDHNNFIGVDRHFNAYGTNVIMPYSGFLNGTQPNPTPAAATNHTDDNTDFYYVANPGAGVYPGGWTPESTQNYLEYTFQHSLHSYIGANQLSLNYDNEGSKRFNWLNLHTPEFIGNNFNAGSDATDPKIEDASSQVYKLNKRLGGASFTPEMIPYQTDIATTSKDASGTTIEIATSNWNLEQWNAIFDAHSGIMFYNFGVKKEDKPFWKKSLWGLLGFSYDQFNFDYSSDPINIKDRVSLNTRINPENQGKTPFIITNALVKTADVSLYRSNMFGASLFTDQGISYGNTWNGGLNIQGKKDAKAPAPDRKYDLNNPAISVETTSVPVVADTQPTKMLKPYYLIRSNIIGDTKYIGGGNSTDGGQTIPIIGVVNKENGFGDYYFQTSQLAQFTITDDVTISEIKTSIHDPDMSLARVDNNSAVLYLIQKQNNNNLNVVNTLLQSEELIPQMLENPQFIEPLEKAYFEALIQTQEEAEKERQSNTETHYQTTGGVPDENIGAIEQFDFGAFAPTAEQINTPEPSQIGTRIRRRVNPGNELGRPRYAGAPTPPSFQRSITRSGGRKLEQYRAFQERARARLYQNFVLAGDAPTHQQAEMPPWYREAQRGLQLERTKSTSSTGSGRSAQTGATSQGSRASGLSNATGASAPVSEAFTGPSDPGSVRSQESVGQVKDLGLFRSASGAN